MHLASVEFLVFGVAFVALWPLFRGRERLRWGFISAASLVFYGVHDPSSVLCLLLCTAASFGAARWMEQRPQARRAALWSGAGVILGALVGWRLVAGIQTHAGALEGWIVPAGVGLYSLQALGYVLDVYHGRVKAARDPLHFLAYMSMFGQLMAGPIVSAGSMLPQLRARPAPSPQERWDGFELIVVGVFKKVVLADHFNAVVQEAFSNPTVASSPLYWWLVMTLFMLGLYCDFSAYCDIARGVGSTLGYTLPRNFEHPLTATTFAGFWRRWHATFTQWFVCRIYKPLVTDKEGNGPVVMAGLATASLVALWHGFAVTFVVWACVHALYLMVERRLGWPAWSQERMWGRFVAAAAVFGLGLPVWVFFRAEGAGQALEIVQTMAALPMELGLTLSHGHLVPTNFMVTASTLNATHGVLLLGVLARHGWVLAGLDERVRWPMWLKMAALGLMIGACVFLRGPADGFYYTQF